MGGLRRALVRTIRFFVLRPAAFVASLIGLVVIVGGLMLLPTLASSIGLPSLRQQAAPTATEDYLHGNRDYNADLVWSSLNSDAQSRLQSGGGSLEGLQQQMQVAREHGIKLEEISYIGGKSLPDGTSMQFYLVGIRQQAASGIDYQPYMFTLDRDGKIAKVQ